MVPFRFQLRFGPSATLSLLLLTCSCIILWGVHLNSKNSTNHFEENVLTHVPRISLTVQKKDAQDLMKNTVVLSSTNSGFLDMAINWLESIKKLGIRPNIILVAEDEEAYEKLKSYKDSTTYIRKGSSLQSTNKSKLVYNTREYKKLVYRRPKYIYDELQKGKNVFFCDVDTFWLKDPFPYFVGDYDVILQRDVYFRKRRVPITYCAGMVYFRSSTPVNRFVYKWSQMTLKEKYDSKANDQTILNKLLNSPDFKARLKRKVLGSHEFPNGQMYFNNTMSNYQHKAVIVHNNWVVGHDIKKKRFQDASLWLVDAFQA
ncbi:UDP-D-xylose:L-fucose alpha-1,3-D-xylosyltransferase 3-like isoform X2 [Anneissia japonica]|uniref:UDP-D-xylose:L-fucose alpha-1,3-D-xylosyltransferase 3-like isoform X2 n=1 Tax=Anneissia japonica TaxID=1529436 RepID=UPI00142567B8|nr:UDP-D-xylose:L-fucose alpha-1,3-D-xylosyltransferase 3-like isoform X2 [Anneissia japonica]XP_033114761.1 UDP-D-xylose:L-fucose alpha-1,3-D-xylosyltransferase 3-like isoform X2 [Anneissia japonica]XP_033114762.1 UDP-D-xylose:L-fucose alpha-1,3-D-xylosyltransferase 3-like isoform X2 [Anneissia japonica]XP_033114763.1 UDP-D-xylose:L-fucose alpha-1,3-D-xylosyltransferase 3-like isoform X2 [Anneissia japonica]XP_033114764.1 UDP-D-xylose:L-fucose alpha-1,3-D-xylosyltransferase 3-like isoform X2 [